MCQDSLICREPEKLQIVDWREKLKKEAENDALVAQAIQNDQLQEQVEENKESGKKPLDLSLLDQKSVKIMIMLMVHLLQQNMTT